MRDSLLFQIARVRRLRGLWGVFLEFSSQSLCLAGLGSVLDGSGQHLFHDGVCGKISIQKVTSAYLEKHERGLSKLRGQSH